MTQTPADALRLVPDEEQIFAWLNRKYVQRADDRQRSMNLQYMEAETHDLSASLHRWLLSAAPASPLPGGGWQELAQEMADEIMQRAKTCEELITDDGDDFADGRVSGKAQAYKHSAELIRAFLARNGKGEGS